DPNSPFDGPTMRPGISSRSRSGSRFASASIRISRWQTAYGPACRWSRGWIRAIGELNPTLDGVVSDLRQLAGKLLGYRPGPVPVVRPNDEVGNNPALLD